MESCTMVLFYALAEPQVWQCSSYCVFKFMV
uniref:Uncharacterized protein n=1 Tax=Trichinella nativa TaxID=6335 RepID=A0A0V1KHN5_9BILA